MSICPVRIEQIYTDPEIIERPRINTVQVWIVKILTGLSVFIRAIRGQLAGLLSKSVRSAGQNGWRGSGER